MSSEKKLSNINFFICSTYKDLKPYREAIIKKIQSSSGVINAQEFFGARDQKPIETCLEEVRKSQVFILILGMRYGSVEKTLNKSFVELEFDEAKKQKILVLAYIIDENYLLPIKDIDRGTKANKLEKFKKMVQDDNTVDKFTSPDNLSDKVWRDLIRELPKKGFSIDEKVSKLAEQKVNIKDLISYFRALPKIYYGKEFSLKVKLGSFSRAPEKECEALLLMHGASLKRTIIPLDKDVKECLGYDLNSVYAQYQLAELLISYDKNTTLEIKVRTTQGVMKTKTPIYSQKRNSQFVQILTSPLYTEGHDMVISGYETSEELLLGLELLEINHATASS